MILLASLEEFAVYRQLSEFDPLDPSALLALDAASEVVRRYTGQSFDLIEDDPAHLDGTGTKALILPQLPVVGVTEVTTFDWGGTSETLLEATAWTLGTAGILWRIDGGTWPSGIGNIDVTYTHGYDTTHPETIPSDLRLVVVQIAARLYASGLSSSSDAASGIVTQETIGGYSVTYADAGSATSTLSQAGVSAEEELVLRAYRMPHVG